MVALTTEGIIEAVLLGEQFNYSTREEALAETLAAAAARIATQTEQFAEAMDVLSPSMPESGLVDACRQVKQAAISWAGNARKLESQLAERDAQIAEMRIVTGPKCPKCGMFLRAKHDRRVGRSVGLDGDDENRWVFMNFGGVCITERELLADHPEIAAELGLTEANDAN